MKQAPLASAVILLAMVFDCRPVSSSPLSAPTKQEVERGPPTDRRDALSSQPQSSNTQPAGNPNQFYQPAPASGLATPSRPSSQLADKRQVMQPKDSFAGPVGSPSRPDFIYTNNGDSARRQNHNNSQSNPNHERPDLFIEGSGVGLPHQGGQKQKPKMDDTEDSGDDDEDKDEDYDYGDTLDSGSGHGQIVSTAQPASSLDRLHPNNFHSPFRQPISTPNSKQTVGASSSTKLTVTTRAPNRMSPTVPMAVVPPVTTLAPVSAPRPTTTTSRNLVVGGSKNRTRGEMDYDYDDGSEDDDSEDSSVFEDNEPVETNNGNSNTTSRPSSATHPDLIDSKKRHNTTRMPSYTFSGHDNLGPQSGAASERSTIPSRHYTTPAPVTPQMMTKPAIPMPAAPPVVEPDPRPGTEADPNSDEDKRAFEDDEDDHDEPDDDDQKDDMEEDSQDDDDPDRATRPSNGSLSANQHNRPHQQPSRPIGSGANATNLTSHQSSRPKLPPSQDVYNKSIAFQKSTTTSKPIVIIPSNTSTPSPVPIPPIAATTAISTTPKMANTSPKPTSPPEVTTPKTTSFAQPARSTTPGATTFRPSPNSATDKQATRFTTSMNTQPGNNRPAQPKATTSLPQYENSDTLTRQVYEKAVEVYQEADRTVRAAWQAVWPPDMNLESSVMEPLLNQPLFFMLALGGTVICLVLLFLLVVYIITYQIQPKDDDSSIY